jgi:hypothetical protein
VRWFAVGQPVLEQNPSRANTISLTRQKKDDITDRVSFLITAILAFVAFQVIVAAKLPDTPYLTLLDKFVMATFAYLTGEFRHIFLCYYTSFFREN